jgi:hypothetical protein
LADHQRWVLAHLRLDGVDLRLRYADLVSVHRDGTGAPDWECVAYGFDATTTYPPGAYRLVAERLDGTSVAGDGFLVRSVDGAHVFRGVGELEEMPTGDQV